jgi:hypothetical protein
MQKSSAYTKYFLILFLVVDIYTYKCMKLMIALFRTYFETVSRIKCTQSSKIYKK